MNFPALVLIAQLTAVPPEMDEAALDALVSRAKETKTDALVVLKDGKTVGEWYFGKKPHPIYAMSMTKSFGSLAIGRLITTGAIKSVDEPVHTWFPEWKQGRKQQITLKHLLQMTSGLLPAETGKELYEQKDLVQYALAAELVSDPGQSFQYDNKAVNLLAAIVQRVSGKPLDVFMRDEVFTPLEIKEVAWDKDAAGTPHAFADVAMLPTDVAKLGQLMLDRGLWKGKRILSEQWVKEAITPLPEQSYGYLWWLEAENTATIDDALLDTLRKGGADEGVLKAVEPLKGKPFSGDEWWAALRGALGGNQGLERWYDNTWRKGLPDQTVLDSRIVGFRADGWLGQQLFVSIPHRLIVVRMRDPSEGNDDVENKKYGMQDLVKLTRKLVKAKPSTVSKASP